jgi:DNA modification methylase
LPAFQNTLYYGDNLDVLKRYLKDESVDLIYLDPPFNSKQDYNVLFAEKSGVGSAAQIKAFEDTWRWDQGAALAYQQTVEAGGKVSQIVTRQDQSHARRHISIFQRSGHTRKYCPFSWTGEAAELFCGKQ